jgi:asparagine synthase (glutamine-hydrolysing)
VSGIAGVYRRDGGALDQAALSAMLARIAHRGPDASRIWLQRSVGLGHCLLTTTPQSQRETLPYHDQNVDRTITADAVLYNREELLDKLELDGDAADSEIILSAYDRWSEGCCAEIVGDFAFVIWDARRQQLLCARDHFGVRPLYYWQSDSLFVFASEVKALFALPEVPRRIDEVRMAEYLGGIPDIGGSRTFYADVQRLSHGSQMVVTASRAATRRYWQLDPNREVRPKSDEACDERFRELFSRSVTRRLRSAFPCGALLSGGLDSSSIVSVAQAALQARGEDSLRTYSALFDSVPASDERRFIAAAVERTGCAPRFIAADDIDPFSDIREILAQQDEPFGNPILFLRTALCSAASADGVRILLDGFVGDTVVSHGLSYLTELARSLRWLSLARELSSLTPYFAGTYKRPLPRLIWHRAIRPLIPLPRQLRRRVRSPWDPLIKNSFAERLALRERLEDERGTVTKPARTAREEHWRNHTMTGVYPYYLEVADRQMIRSRIRPSYPFLDPALAEFCLALPGDQKLRRGWSRFFFRRAMSDRLAHDVAWRQDKSNLNPMLIHGLATCDRESLRRMLGIVRPLLEPYANVDVIDRSYRAVIAVGDPTRLQIMPDVLRLWRSVTAGLWLSDIHLGLAPPGASRYHPPVSSAKGTS